MSEILSYLPVIALAVSIGTLAYTIHYNRSTRYEERFNAADLKTGVVAGKLDLLEDRVTIVENDLKHLPDKDTTHRLEIALGKIETEMGKLTERMIPLANIAGRMQDTIMEKVLGS